jgi:hypothetical protein
MKRRHFLKRSLAGASLATFGASLPGNLFAEAEPVQNLALSGARASAFGSYTRMFSELKGKPARPSSDIEEGLARLGEAMVDKDPLVEAESQPELPTAGYTYFGQFIDHDLTLDLTPLNNASEKIEQTQNFRTAFLDLDHLYGGGPNMSPFLYAIGNRNAERFLIGKTIETPGREASDDDLPRNFQGIALTGDPRQDENLILAQLHVAFLKLHNRVIDQPDELNASPHYRQKGDSDFATAQRVMRWHYQWVVRHDYLEAIIDPLVAERLSQLEQEKRGRPKLDFRIPVEFSVAAFRFGHSMVRDVYKTGVNDIHDKEVKLATLLERTGSKGGAAPALPADWVISWERFFSIPPRTSLVNRARKIDTQIANALHHLDEQAVKDVNLPLPSDHLEPKLAVRTLLRGFRVNLPSGEDVAAEIARRMPGIKVLTEDEIVSGPHKDVLTNPKYGFRNNTPLWYYILKEAEVAPLDGKHLGPIGSYIVADVILGALAADADSYLLAPGWEPTLERGRRNSMREMLDFVNGSGARRRSST